MIRLSIRLVASLSSERQFSYVMIIQKCWKFSNDAETFVIRGEYNPGGLHFYTSNNILPWQYFFTNSCWSPFGRQLATLDTYIESKIVNFINLQCIAQVFCSWLPPFRILLIGGQSDCFLFRCIVIATQLSVNISGLKRTGSLAPDPFFIFLFFLFLLFLLRGHNTCIACRIFVYFSPLARKKGSATGNLKLD